MVILFHTHSVFPAPLQSALFPHSMLTAVDSCLRHVSFAMIKWIKSISTFLYEASLSFSLMLHNNIAYPLTRFTGISTVNKDATNTAYRLQVKRHVASVEGSSVVPASWSCLFLSREHVDTSIWVGLWTSVWVVMWTFLPRPHCLRWHHSIVRLGTVQYEFWILYFCHHMILALLVPSSFHICILKIA